MTPIYHLYKLSIVPNIHNEVLSPPFPYLALHEKEFRYIEAECPKTTKWYLCEEKPNLQEKSSGDCIQHLITTQQRNSFCTPVAVTLNKPAYEELDERHYTISFPSPTKIHLSCGQDLYQTLQGSYLAIIPQQCYVETPLFTISNTHDRLRGQALKLMDLPNITAIPPTKIPALKLTSISLRNLHQINTKINQQLPVQLNNESDYSLYHTTLPLYVVILSAGALISALYYRQNCARQSRKQSEEGQPQLQAIYALPAPRRVNSNQPLQHPAQFSTKVVNSRCSSGGGVTHTASMGIADIASTHN